MKPEIFDAVHRRLTFLKSLADSIIKMQKNEPDGRLRITNKKGKVRMYLRENESDRTGRYIPQSEYELACRLAKKGYLGKALTTVNGEIEHLKEYIDDCAGNTIEDLFGKLSTPRQEMFEPVIETDEKFVDRWKSQQFIQKPFGDDTISYKSKRGEKFRSKSELLIADELFYANIPYRYECKTMIGGIPVYPDFTVLNVARRRVYIWEHLGKLGDQDYADNTAVKLNNYLANGYYPGVNLLITWETSRTPIKMELVRDMMERFLLN
ncbi:MAG: hypothetical protein J5584_03270 [Clostridia bacterium]|nr:hypothetical protein [Clostridia bacterium]